MPLFKRKKLLQKQITEPFSYGGERSNSLAFLPNGVSLAEEDGPSNSINSAHVHSLELAEKNFNPAIQMRTKSRLSKTLPEVLEDNSALPYFIQFMESEGQKHLVHFWLEAESFRSSAWIRVAEQVGKSAKHLGNNIGSKRPILSSSDSSGCYSLKSDAFQSTSCEESGIASDKTSPTDDEVRAELGPEETCVNSCVEETSDELAKSIETNVSAKSPKKLDGACVNNINSGKDELSRKNVIGDDESRTRLESQIATETNCKDFSSEQKVPFVKLKTSTEQDALHIFKKYIAEDALCSIGVSSSLRTEISDAISGDDGNLNPNAFVGAQKFVEGRMEKSYLSSFLRSSFHCKHQIDVLTSGQVYLADILHNDSTLFYFMEFMEQEGVRHLVDFLMMTENFCSHLRSQPANHDTNQAQDDAMVIYDKYFSLQASIPLGFSDRIRFEVEQNICQESGPNPDCFLKPVMIVLQFLEKSFLPQFLNSQLYFKYLSECITTIQMTGITQGHRRRSGSDSSSSEVGSHTTNTLLAMDSKQPGVAATKKVLKNIEHQDMRIDTGQFEPDTLWRRSQSGKLQMAYVDHFGKLTTDFEPEPDRKTGSKLSKAMKKFVNWEDDKAQEDMAWQVAKMIVKDVCSVTLANDESNSISLNRTH